MTDKILIRQLKIDTVIGIHEWEKAKTQPILLDLDLSFDCKRAAQTDHIDDALDYFAVCKEVTEFVASNHYELIETLAEQVAQLILSRFPCKKIKLSLYKPEAIDNTETVGLRIVRKS